MEIDSEVIAELWNCVRDYVPANRRNELITAMLEVFLDNEIDINDLDDIKGVDDDLDEAIEEVFGDVDTDEEYDS